MSALLLLLACAGGPGAALDPGPTVWLESPRIAAGAQGTLHAPADAVLEAAEGLLVVPAEEPGTFHVSGPDGSYVLTVTPSGGAPVALFVDIGVEGPKAGDLEDLADLPAPPPPVWPLVLAAIVAVVALVGLGAWAWKRFRPVPPPPIPDSPEVVARKAWAALRARTDLPAEEVARQMSEIFRSWLDASWGFPATRRTSREILDILAGGVTAAELDAARRLLMATDLVKFAEREGHADLFERLDNDFHSLVRPGARRA